MKDARLFIKNVIEHLPSDWLCLTTHRLDIYDEAKAKTQFLEHFEDLFETSNSSTSALSQLPTAYDYIRLGHPLSCVLEWGIAKAQHLNPEHVISFSSRTVPILAVLRKNLLENKKTIIYHTTSLPDFFDADLLRRVYGYQFDLKKTDSLEAIGDAAVAENYASSMFIAEDEEMSQVKLPPALDFYINFQTNLGSVIIVNGIQNEEYISEIQHIRRRESIAMTPSNALSALKKLMNDPADEPDESASDRRQDPTSKSRVLELIGEITGSNSKALVASSGLSMQYAIMMGLVHHALEQHPGKDIKFIVPPNCYGGTNDQARRVAACIDNVEMVDLLVDGANDMVQSIDTVLDQLANDNAVPYIIAEIPTNPRVEVPDLSKLKAVLSRERTAASGKMAIEPVFILDQTFCPNVHFLGDGDILSTVKTISYVSGSKFPSGGKCTAGYCVGNKKTDALLDHIEVHLNLCDNEATLIQYDILATQMPSMKQRIDQAYLNTREFVDFIRETLPSANINFVTEDLADQGFRPSVFSLDLPTKGTSDEEKEAYKRALNLKLIRQMITEIPEESKFCVSYGQLEGCYWTIPATSTQGTTKEDDKDYIVRVALAPHLDLERHKEVWLDFVKNL